MWSMSGFGAMYTADNVDDLDSGEEVSDASNNSSVSKFDADAGPNQGGNIIGLIFAGLDRLIGLAGLVLLLPAELHDLGFPWWFSLPIGLLAQTIVGIGIFEFASQREWT
jgi:hypothetical protein